MNFIAMFSQSPFFSAVAETPTPRPSINPDDVSPGIESFIIAFLLALVILGLVWSMTRHLRRVQVRAQQQDEAAEAAEAAKAGPGREPETGPETDSN